MNRAAHAMKETTDDDFCAGRMRGCEFYEILESENTTLMVVSEGRQAGRGRQGKNRTELYVFTLDFGRWCWNVLGAKSNCDFGEM